VGGKTKNKAHKTVRLSSTFDLVQCTNKQKHCRHERWSGMYPWWISLKKAFSAAVNSHCPEWEHPVSPMTLWQEWSSHRCHELLCFFTSVLGHIVKPAIEWHQQLLLLIPYLVKQPLVSSLLLYSLWQTKARKHIECRKPECVANTSEKNRFVCHLQSIKLTAANP